ncbi:MAG: DNA-binding protein Alba [Thermoprotei archaeon]
MANKSSTESEGAKAEAQKAKAPGEENVIYVGSKPPMSYVMACLVQLNGGAPSVTLKARGRAISGAVDVAEMLRNRFMKDALKIKSINISTEQLEAEGGRMKNVSAIEIVLEKK